MDDSSPSTENNDYYINLAGSQGIHKSEKKLNRPSLRDNGINHHSSQATDVLVHIAKNVLFSNIINKRLTSSTI